MAETKQFAYGKNTIAGCECPAVAAGFEPASGDDSILAAEMYDEQVAENGFTNAQSIINEEAAKESWLAMIEKMDRLSYGNYDNLQVAKDVAEKFGWL